MKREQTNFIYLSSTNTTPDKDLSLRDLDQQHRKRGWFECIYHFVIRRSGAIEKGRDYEHHSAGLGRLNAVAVSICLVGGQGEPPFTVQQDESLKDLVMELHEEYPEATLRFHASYPQQLEQPNHDDR